MFAVLSGGTGPLADAAGGPGALAGPTPGTAEGEDGETAEEALPQPGPILPERQPDPVTNLRWEALAAPDPRASRDELTAPIPRPAVKPTAPDGAGTLQASPSVIPDKVVTAAAQPTLPIAMAETRPQSLPEPRSTQRTQVERGEPAVPDRTPWHIPRDVAPAEPGGKGLPPETGNPPPAQADLDPLAGNRVEEIAPHQPTAEPRRIATEHAAVPGRAGSDAPPPAERQIVAAILSTGSGRTEILLDPQDLGRVRLSLEGNEAGLVVTVVAERAETADLLRRNADLLLAEFRDAGYANLSFSFADRGQGADPWPESDELQDGPTLLTDAATATQSLRPLTGTATLDLRL